MSNFNIKNGILLKYSGFDEIIITPDNIEAINQCAFSYCQNIKKIVISDNVTTIGDYAFDNCYNLVSVTIGKNISKIGFKAFNNCFSLTHIYFKKKYIYTNEYLGIPNNCQIHIIE